MINLAGKLSQLHLKLGPHLLKLRLVQLARLHLLQTRLESRLLIEQISEFETNLGQRVFTVRGVIGKVSQVPLHLFVALLDGMQIVLRVQDKLVQLRVEFLENLLVLGTEPVQFLSGVFVLGLNHIAPLRLQLVPVSDMTHFFLYRVLLLRQLQHGQFAIVLLHRQLCVEGRQSVVSLFFDVQVRLCNFEPLSEAVNLSLQLLGQRLFDMRLRLYNRRNQGEDHLFGLRFKHKLVHTHLPLPVSEAAVVLVCDLLVLVEQIPALLHRQFGQVDFLFAVGHALRRGPVMCHCDLEFSSI